MDDSFKVRVDKLFGSSLFQSVPKSGFPESSWSVFDGEVEKKEWNREKGDDTGREDIPCSSAYDEDGDGCFSKKNRMKNEKESRKRLEDYLDDQDDLDDLDDDDDGDAEDEGGDADDEERDIRSSIGLDPTLDHEDEEDDYDREAICKENIGDRIYLGDVTDHKRYMNYHSVVTELDDESTLLQNVKPILKRKGNLEDSKPKKHVRFDSEENKASHFKLQFSISRATTSEASTLPVDSPGIPDYLKNPSKYVRYSFDISDKVDDQKSFQKAFEDFRNMVRKPQSAELETESTELPKTVVFTPRKKMSDAMVTENSPAAGNDDACNDSVGEANRPIGIAAGDAQESEACAMEEDSAEPSTEEKGSLSRRADRKYRSKSSSDD